LWGRHELDRRWADHLVDCVQIQPGELVVDVGAGTGVITDALLRAGARVIAVELHPRRAATLRVRFATRPVTIVQADAADLRLPRRPFKVVANPPFGITTALLRRLTSPASRMERASLVLPAWAAMRWAAGRGVGGVTSRRRFEHLLGGRVPANAFRPPPPTDAAILIITCIRKTEM
jgi:23S rRNA (adenine-N6)-dimethyltransferase